MKSSNLASSAIQQKAPVATQILTEKSGESESSSSALKISSTSSVSKVDELLVTAYTRYEAGDVVESRRIYDQVLSMDQNNRDAQLGRAAIHVIDKEYEQAIAMYQDVLTENPKDTVAIASLISVANIKPQTGETQLKSLLREQPETAYLHFALGNVYGSQRRWTEAQSSYFTAFEHKPDDPNYAYNLAVSLEHINKPQAAVSYYQRALDNQANKKATFDSQLVAQRIEVLTQ
jgi:tetratricopeptide (TPR) repeat protein